VLVLSPHFSSSKAVLLGDPRGHNIPPLNQPGGYMAKSRSKVVPSVNGGVFAHDSMGSKATVQVNGGLLSWRDFASVIDKNVHLFHIDKFTESASPGPVIPVVKVYLVFWGTAWLATPRPVPYSADIINAVSSILNSPYLSKVDQYDNRLHYGHPSQRGSLAGTTIVSTVVGPSASQSPADPPNPFQNTAVTGLVTNLIANRTLPSPDDEPNALYVVVMPKGVSSTTGFGGYHYTSSIPGNSNQAHIAWVTNSGTLSAVTTIFSHELVESVTDPEGTAVTGVPGTCNQSGWCEIGDICNTTGVVNGVVVQSYWSDEDQACVVPTTFPYQDFIVNKYRVLNQIALWLLIHGGDPAPFDGSTPNIREQATVELIKQLASTLSDASVAQNIQTAIASSGQRIQTLSKPAAARKKPTARNRAG
jgi:hypothetical protein